MFLLRFNSAIVIPLVLNFISSGFATDPLFLDVTKPTDLDAFLRPNSQSSTDWKWVEKNMHPEEVSDDIGSQVYTFAKLCLFLELPIDDSILNQWVSLIYTNYDEGEKPYHLCQSNAFGGQLNTVATTTKFCLGNFFSQKVAISDYAICLKPLEKSMTPLYETNSALVQYLDRYWQKHERKEELKRKNELARQGWIDRDKEDQLRLEEQRRAMEELEQARLEEERQKYEEEEQARLEDERQKYEEEEEARLEEERQKYEEAEQVRLDEERQKYEEEEQARLEEERQKYEEEEQRRHVEELVKQQNELEKKEREEAELKRQQQERDTREESERKRLEEERRRFEEEEEEARLIKELLIVDEEEKQSAS